MAEYKNIKGFTVQTLATDTIASQAAGGSWASGGDLNTGRNGLRGAGISQTATVVFGGNDGSVTGKTENYNGSSWTETTDLNTGKTNAVGTGTYTAAIAAYTSTAETWNGSSWTEVSEMNTSRQEVGSLGTSTAALAIGNQNAASGIVEQWNGSTWTEVNDLTTAVGVTAGFGTTSAGNAAGGGIAPGASVANNQSWNGSSWTEVGDLNQNRYFGSASGTSTSGLVFAGYRSSPASEIANTESWNGTSFTEQADLSTARFTGGPAHNSTQADSLLAGGNPSNKVNTEEWSAPSDFVQINIGQLYFNSATNTFKETITDMAGATWASAPSLNTNTRYFCGGAGSTTAALICGGQNPVTANTELFDGSAWTEVNNLNAAKVYHSVTGLQTAAMAVGGSPAPSYGTNNEQWDGTNWTESTESNDSTNDRSQCGITTAAIFFGNSNNYTELWNGSAFTEGANMNNARGNLAGGGIQTLAIGANGYKAPLGSDEVELWDGSSWTETTESNTSRQSVRGAGTQTAFIMSMGNRPGGAPSLPGNTTSAYTEFWNGTSWTELNDMSTARYAGASSQGPASSSTSALYSGGYTGTAYSAASEEWTADVANKTITAS